MATFAKTSNLWQRIDWQIFQNGWVSLYWKNEILEKHLRWFESEGYTIVEFDCSTWNDEVEMHNQIKQKLNFPEYYGKNFNALNDCLSDLRIIKTGQIVLFRHLDKIDKRRANILIDVFANSSRMKMLFGKRLITLIQVNDPNYQMNEVAATTVNWNRAEWSKLNRQ